MNSYFYFYAAVGSMLLRHIDGELRNDYPVSMLILFYYLKARILDHCEALNHGNPCYQLDFYLAFISVVVLVFNNVMIGVVPETAQQKLKKTNPKYGTDEAGEVNRIVQRTLLTKKRMEQLLQPIAKQTNIRRSSAILFF